ncbi:MAG: hypothetical protein ACYC0H_19200 [Solirubrobacteraceae bacterium]
MTAPSRSWRFSQRDLGYQERRAAVDPLLQEMIANGVYGIVQTRTADHVLASSTRR